MQAWTKPDIPVVPGPARRLRLYDTASGGPVEVPPGDDGTARMYVCGITPYDATHMGHAATYVTFDLINRLWRDAGYDVHYTQNITDVDDPLLERATATGVDWTDLAERRDPAVPRRHDRAAGDPAAGLRRRGRVDRPGQRARSRTCSGPVPCTPSTTTCTSR